MSYVKHLVPFLTLKLSSKFRKGWKRMRWSEGVDTQGDTQSTHRVRVRVRLLSISLAPPRAHIFSCSCYPIHVISMHGHSSEPLTLQRFPTLCWTHRTA